MSLMRQAWLNRLTRQNPEVINGSDPVSTVIEVSVSQLHAVIHHTNNSTAPANQKVQEINKFFEEARTSVTNDTSLSDLLRSIQIFCSQATRTETITIPRAHLQKLNVPPNRLIYSLPETGLNEVASRLSQWSKQVAPPPKALEVTPVI